jgi:hypothetical protein
VTAFEPRAEPSRYDVFVSHSSPDKATADAVCAALEAERIRCWIAPRDITPGASWSESIVEALRRSRAVVLIFSGHANDSPQIRNELVQAAHLGLPILPFRIEATIPAKSLAYFIDGVHWLDALTPPLEAHIGTLVAMVRRLLSEPRVSATGELHSPPPTRAADLAGPRAPGRLSRRTAVVVGAGALTLAAGGGALWFAIASHAPAPRAALVFSQPREEDLAKIRDIAAKDQFRLPEFAFTPPVGDVDPAALRFVGAWASESGYFGVGRQVMLIVTSARADGQVEGFLLHGPPVGAGWDAAIPAFTAPFASRVVDGVFEIRIQGATVSYSARFDPKGEALMFSAQRPEHRAALALLKPLWRAAA